MEKRQIKYIVLGNCWWCTSHCCNSEGYPVITINGKQDKIYRHSYRIYKGIIPIGGVIRHTCDNRLCINPEHLLLGSHADNVKDRVERNRSATGVKNGRSKLTEGQVIEIFRDEGTPRLQLARKYRIDARVIRDIINRKTWRAVTANL